MSGHSKWATIKHAKGINDAKRGKIFSRLSKLISIAVREGGGIDNPDDNPKLRMMMEKARAENMPNDNIKRAIDKGAGRIEGASYEEIVYEGFGPNKVAMMIECTTDNKNRTNSEIKITLDKSGGILAASGSTSYFFDRKGVITVLKPEEKDLEEFQLELIDFEISDFGSLESNRLKLFVEASKTHEISEAISKSGIKVVDYDVEMIPNIFVTLEEKEFEKFNKFLEIIDDQDDVLKIYHNAKKA